MDDLIAKLRSYTNPNGGTLYVELMEEAAATIERLTRELADEKQIAERFKTYWNVQLERANKAEAALAASQAREAEMLDALRWISVDG